MFGGSPKEKLQAALDKGDKGDLRQLKMAITSAKKEGVEAALIEVSEGLANAWHQYGIMLAFQEPCPG